MLDDQMVALASAKRSVPRAFRPDVEGLRAIAIGLVVLYHYDLGPFHGGYVGVDVFFVISGFVITSMLLRERQKTQATSLLDFYARRIRRILPASALVLVATTIATFAVLGTVQGMTTVSDARAAALFVANYHFAAQQLNYFTSNQSPSTLVHYWSLSIEEQFYFVWPTLLLCACALLRTVKDRFKLGLVLGAIVIASLTYSIVLTPSNQTLAYYSSLTRAWELALGALVAVSAPLLAKIPDALAPWLTWIGVAGIIYAGLEFTSTTPFPGYAVALPVVATAITIASGAVRHVASAEVVLGSRPFLWFGALSYSLYLWHWPLWAIVTEDIGHAPPVAARIGLVFAAVALSFASLRLVENPVRRSTYLKNRRHLSIGVGVVLIASTLVIVSAVGWAWPTQSAWTGRPTVITSQAQLHRLLVEGSTITSLPGLVVPLGKVPATEFPPANGCLVSDTTPTATGNRPSDCTFGDVRSSTVVVLFGDSQAAMWLPAFDKLGKERHWRIELYARAACRVADLELWDYPLNAPGVGCTLWHTWSVNQINALHPKYIFVADHATFGNINYDRVPYTQMVYAAAILATIHKLAQPGTSLAFLGPIPQPAQDPVTCLSRNESNVQACSTSLADATRTVNLASVLSVSLASGFPLIPTTAWFCTATTCPTIADHTVMYFDADHVSLHFSLLLSNLLGNAISAKTTL